MPIFGIIKQVMSNPHKLYATKTAPVHIAFAKSSAGSISAYIPREYKFMNRDYNYKHQTSILNVPFELKPAVISKQKQDEYHAEIVEKTKTYLRNVSLDSYCPEEYYVQRLFPMDEDEFLLKYNSFIKGYKSYNSKLYTSADVLKHSKTLFDIYTNPNLGYENKKEIKRYIKNGIKNIFIDGKPINDIEKPNIDLSEDAGKVKAFLLKGKYALQKQNMINQIDGCLQEMAENKNKYGSIPIAIFVLETEYSEATKDIQKNDVKLEIKAFNEERQQIQNNFNEIAILAYEQALKKGLKDETRYRIKVDGISVKPFEYSKEKLLKADKAIKDAEDQEKIARIEAYKTLHRKIVTDDLIKQGSIDKDATLNDSDIENATLSSEAMRMLKELNKAYGK